MSLTDDDKIDPLLREWRKSLDCDDTQKARMREELFAQLSLSGVTLPPKHRPMSWRVAATWLGLSVCLAAGLLFFALKIQPFQNLSTNELALDATLFRFTSNDLRRSEKIASEVERLFENQVKTVSLVGNKLQFHFDQGISIEKGPRLVLRFILQRRRHEKNAEWQSIYTEDVIGQRDHQFEFADSARVSIEYWSHLLPDNSLWIETKTTFDEGSFDHEARALANQPQILWSDESKVESMRLLFVYELLEGTEGGIF